MKRLTSILLLATALAAGASAASAQEPMNIVFTHHSSASNPFWQAVKKGFDDACAKIQANCQMIFTQTEGSIEQQSANMQAALVEQAGRADHLDRRQQRLRPDHRRRPRRRRHRHRLECRRHRRRQGQCAAGLHRARLHSGRLPARQEDVRILPEGGQDQSAGRRLRARPELVGAARRRRHEVPGGVQGGERGPRGSWSSGSTAAPTVPSSRTASAPI